MGSGSGPDGGSHFVLPLGLGVGWVLGHLHTPSPCLENEVGEWQSSWGAEQETDIKESNRTGIRGRQSQRKGHRNRDRETRGLPETEQTRQKVAEERKEMQAP